MNKTITFTPDSMAIVDGDIYVSDNIKPSSKEWFIFYGDNETSLHQYHSDAGYGVKTYTNFNEDDESSLILSTSKCSSRIVCTSNLSLPNVKHLDRTLFYKPDVDVKELYDKTKSELCYEPYNNSLQFFKAGYNANNKEFTREELRTAWSFGVQASDGFDELIKILRPVSIPKLLEADNEFNVINVKW